MRKFILLLTFISLFTIQCSNSVENNSVFDNNNYELQIPQGFPEPEIPDDNYFTKARIALGKKLFFDPILSLDSTISCGSCHFQKYAFSDSVAISPGVNGAIGNRNAPPLFNLAWARSFFHDGGVPTLEMQILGPIQTEEEMHLNILVAAERLKQHPDYPRLIKDAYDREPDPYSITRAIACFERTIISGNSPYDQYTFQGKTISLSPSEMNGKSLFFSDSLNCSKCHSGFNFTNNEVVSNGLYENYDDDPGKMRLSLDKKDEGMFKVPSLRNVSLTAPYMHDGSLHSLKKVIQHYSSGGSNHPNKSQLITGFNLSDRDVDDLIAFLHTLTDKDFINNPAYKLNASND